MSDNTQPTIDKVLTSIIDVYWAVRILREWEKRGWTPRQQIEEREFLALVLFAQCGQPTLLEREVGGILGLPASTASDLVKKLLELGLITRPDADKPGRREKPLALTSKGKLMVAASRKAMCERYRYLFDDLPIKPSGMPAIEAATEQIKDNALAHLRKQVILGEYVVPSDRE